MEKDKKPSLLRRSILANLVLIIATGILFMWLALIFVDYWTDHGVYKVVPNVVGMSYDDAVRTLESEGLNYEISDSVYTANVAPGHVVEQSPRSDSKVKNRRTVYLVVKAFSTKMETLPSLVDMSVRQAESSLEGLGFTKVKVETVPSEYKDLVLAVRVNGKLASAGARVPVTSVITLEVGEGLEEIDLDDSLETDSIEKIDLI
ncbi:MAG: PASTA domain-containing protein [Muribaculaceae bacterium]|nr:PASTA domain-containing protein [Muribaculaceae bacterium]